MQAQDCSFHHSETIVMLLSSLITLIIASAAVSISINTTEELVRLVNLLIALLCLFLSLIFAPIPVKLLILLALLVSSKSTRIALGEINQIRHPTPWTLWGIIAFLHSKFTQERLINVRIVSIWYKPPICMVKKTISLLQAPSCRALPVHYANSYGVHFEYKNS